MEEDWGRFVAVDEAPVFFLAVTYESTNQRAGHAPMVIWKQQTM